MKIVKYIFLIIWTLWCIIGIVKNYSHYEVGEWIVVILFTAIPYLILWYIAKRKTKKGTRAPQNIAEESVSEINVLSDVLPDSVPQPITQTISQPAAPKKDNKNVDPIQQLETAQKMLNESLGQLNKALSSENIIKVTVQENNTPTITPSSSLTYIDDDKMIVRAEGEKITDNEVPHLVQAGFEKAMEKHGGYHGEILDLSFMQERDKNKKEFTRLPSYEELLAIETNNNLPICSTDIFFLKYLNGLTLENPFIAQYWYYDYNLNYTAEIKKLISTELLMLSDINISKLNVDELKNILRHFNLPLTGKKSDLQKRVLANIEIEDIVAFLGNQIHYFSVTEKGKSLIDTTYESATKNLELENACIEFNMDYAFHNAISLIENFKRSTPAGINYISLYNSNMEKRYQNIMDDDTFSYTLTKDYDIEHQIRAVIVFCHMYGCSQQNTLKAIKRIYFENNKIFTEDAHNILRGRLL